MMPDRKKSEDTKTDVTSSIKLEDLFDVCRIKVRPRIYKVILYFPFALILLLLRLITGIFGFIILSLLPKTSHKRSAVLKGICKIWGLVIEIDNKYNDENAKLLVANHVSIWDRLAVNVMVPCSTISKDREVENEPLSFCKDVDFTYSRDLTHDEILALQQYMEHSSVPILHFPEGTTTNGKVGLLKFHPAVFTLNAPVQPILIRVEMHSFLTVLSPSVLNSSPWADILWSFVFPSTFFYLKTLPSMGKLPNETTIEFSKRVQQTMAHAMNLAPTVFTSADKGELSKRLQTTAEIASSKSTLESGIPVTGHCSSAMLNSKHRSSNLAYRLSLNTAAVSFGKSPKERMLSYQERRMMLIEAARIKYLEKHNI